MSAYADFSRVVKLLGNSGIFSRSSVGKSSFLQGLSKEYGLSIKRLVGYVGEARAASRVSLPKFHIDLNLIHCR